MARYRIVHVLVAAAFLAGCASHPDAPVAPEPAPPAAPKVAAKPAPAEPAAAPAKPAVPAKPEVAAAPPAKPEPAPPVKPVDRAQAVRDMKWGMFICWSFSTFSGREWTPTKDKGPEYFKVTGCDTDQWARTAKEARMGYILFLF